jgi:hypothetical protein
MQEYEKDFIKGGEFCPSSVVQPEVSRRNFSIWSYVCIESKVFHKNLSLKLSLIALLDG